MENKFYTEEAFENFQNQLLDLAYTQVDLVFGKFSKDKSRSITVLVTDQNLDIRVQTRKDGHYSGYTFGSLEAGLNKLKQLDDQIFSKENADMWDPESVRAARMIHEIRTLTLGPDDKLVVSVKDDVGMDGLRALSDGISRWLGDKGHHRVIVMKGADIVKIERDDGSSEEKSSES